MLNTLFGGLGGGPSSATPPDSPHQEGRQTRGMSDSVTTQISDTLCDSSSQTDLLYSFSPALCLKLLPDLSDEHITAEVAYFKAHNQTLAMRSSTATIASKRVALRKYFVNNIVSSFDDLVSKYSNLTETFSFFLEKAEKNFEDMLEKTTKFMQGPSASTLPQPAPSPEPEPAADPAADPAAETLHGNLPEPVSFLSEVSFEELTVDVILAQLGTFQPSSCGRHTVYFGPHPYSYGRFKHPAAPYPMCDFFSTFFDRIHNFCPDFTPDHYTCLITHYPDGSSFIPSHSDNEHHISEDSNIFTISIGAPRVLNFTNITGPIQEQRHTLQHGSVHVMSSESQLIWEHSIIKDTTITQPRISFTFRKLQPQLLIPDIPAIPPIAPPKPPKPPMSIKPIDTTHKRVLFLTDSILSHSPTPSYISDQIEDHMCVKKTNYELRNIFNFEPEFGYSDFVVISGGINDLSRHGLRAHTLADLVCNRLRDTCLKYDKTVFIFNSLLDTRFDWVNSEIQDFNKLMFELCLVVPNLYFFDSHHVLTDYYTSGGRVLNDRGNGVHITVEARKLVARQLVHGIHHLFLSWTGRRVEDSRLRNWWWPLRSAYRQAYDTHRGVPVG